MKIEMSNRELFEVIEKAVNGDVKAKFEILIIFEPLINSESYIKNVKTILKIKYLNTLKNLRQ